MGRRKKVRFVTGQELVVGVRMGKNVNGRGQTVSPDVMPSVAAPLSARSSVVESVPGPSTAPPALRALDKHGGFVAGRKVTNLPTDKRVEWLETVVVDLLSKLEVAESLVEDHEREIDALQKLVSESMPKPKRLSDTTLAVAEFLQQHAPLKFGIAAIAENLELSPKTLAHAIRPLTSRGVSRSEGGAGKTLSYWVERDVTVDVTS